MASHRHLHILIPVALLAGLAACGDASAPVAKKPVTADSIGKETELLRLTLTPEAVTRLGIVTTEVGAGTTARIRNSSGEIVAPTGTSSVPIRSVTDLAAMATAQATAEGAIAAARAQVEVAKLNYNRAERLLGLQAGSARIRDEAKALLASNQATLNAAIEQRRLLGPAMRNIGSNSVLWVRVPVFGSDVSQLVEGDAAQVRPLGSDAPALTARPVKALPSSDAAAGTVDLYFALPSGNGLRIGQRVAVDLPLKGNVAGLTIPATAIVRDIYGGEWVYEQVAPGQFQRRRVEISAARDGTAVVARGLEGGAKIVTAGAAELFGSEFGIGR